MKLIELLVFCAILIVFMRIFTLATIQITDYRSRVTNLMHKTEMILQKHGDLLHANSEVGMIK